MPVQKKAEPINMLFWMKTLVGPRNYVLDGGVDPRRGLGNFGGCPVHSKALAIFTSAVIATFAAIGINLQ